MAGDDNEFGPDNNYEIVWGLLINHRTNREVIKRLYVDMGLWGPTCLAQASPEQLLDILEAIGTSDDSETKDEDEEEDERRQNEIREVVLDLLIEAEEHQTAASTKEGGGVSAIDDDNDDDNEGLKASHVKKVGTRSTLHRMGGWKKGRLKDLAMDRHPEWFGGVRGIGTGIIKGTIKFVRKRVKSVRRLSTRVRRASTLLKDSSVRRLSTVLKMSTVFPSPEEQDVEKKKTEERERDREGEREREREREKGWERGGVGKNGMEQGEVGKGKKGSLPHNFIINVDPESDVNSRAPSKKWLRLNDNSDSDDDSDSEADTHTTIFAFSPRARRISGGGNSDEFRIRGRKKLSDHAKENDPLESLRLPEAPELWVGSEAPDYNSLLESWLVEDDIDDIDAILHKHK